MYLVESAYDWDAANNLDLGESQTCGLVWLDLETEIRFYRSLQYMDKIDNTVWMVAWQKVRGTKAFELRLKDCDEIVAQGTQQVVSLDEDDLRP